MNGYTALAVSGRRARRRTTMSGHLLGVDWGSVAADGARLVDKAGAAILNVYAPGTGTALSNVVRPAIDEAQGRKPADAGLPAQKPETSASPSASLGPLPAPATPTWKYLAWGGGALAGIAALTAVAVKVLKR